MATSILCFLLNFMSLSHQSGTSHVARIRWQVAGDTWHGDCTPKLHMAHVSLQDGIIKGFLVLVLVWFSPLPYLVSYISLSASLHHHVLCLYLDI